MEPQDTPTPSDKPNAPQDSAPSIEPTQTNPSPVNSQPSEQPLPTTVQPTVQSTPDSLASTPQTPNSPVQAVSEPTDGVQSPTVQPVVSASASVVPPVSSGSSKKRWMLPLVVVIVLALLAGGGYAFAFYLPNRPGAVYATSLKRTGEAADKLVDYANTEAQKHYKSYSLDGKLTVAAEGTNFDATVNGSSDAQANLTATLKADVMGEHLTADLRSVRVGDSTSPDLYLRATGIKNMLDATGLNNIDGLDGKWLSIDHTLLNAYAANYNSDASKAAFTMPTAAQSHDALVKVQAVNKQYLFTTDTAHAVMQNNKYVGKETKDGREVYHYTVGYNKAHLKSYVDGLSTALDSSSLNNWAKKANDSKSLSETLDFSQLKSMVDSAKAGYTFDVWIDAKTKLMQSVQFGDIDKPGSTFTVAQNYVSGNSYPFSFSYQSKSDDGTPASASLKLTVDTATDKQTGVLAVDADKTKIGLNFTVTPSTSGVQVTAPTGAESVVDLLSSLRIGNF